MIIQCYAHPTYHCEGIDRPTGVVYHDIPDELAEEVQIQAKSEEYLDPPCLATILLELTLRKKAT